ncbi:23S rRNA (adenine(2030)-N(6))-methyltransferase RlmJ [Paraferrimonas sedimenticola]|uniref:Ribosomal RNA large subunit methyltransferase J n=1 Tax=Paraferrimonas sedimenticola TaxID=375674 RepID=A0AA37VUW3_9GAMM|nr:23S rRNA (adenine(2030)-N(6))-methyltransferase RlmJ [Paraferrimonas sedimenticola]GLP95934.1 ribosomal RNA large subunit methyltransferase J [Paraferrimonas sedimenticola]
MLSYRHSFHAGNHADIIKHASLCLIIDALKAKAKPFSYLDSHSGGGLYDLQDETAQKTGEYLEGIARLLPIAEQLPELAPYFDAIAAHNSSDALRFYPGSPELARQWLRDQDQLHLMELHNNEIDRLRANLGGDERVGIHHRDGFEGLPGILPLPVKRGVALVDPSYEIKSDYAKVVKSVKKASQRWNTGIFAIWYPMLASDRDQSPWLLDELSKLPVKNLLVAELSVAPQAQDFGMHGSGMAIINAPYQLDDKLKTLLPKLSAALDPDQRGDWSLEWLIQPS